MRVVFMGTPEFAAVCLRALHGAAFGLGHEIVGVFTQPDRPAGRGQKLQASAVSLAAESLNLPVFKPEKLKTPEQQALVQALQPDLIVVVAYGLILPQAVLDMAFCLNVHASLLPRWRGAAPIQRALLAGDHETGITLMRMEAGLDTGPMLLKATLPIQPQHTSQALHDALAGMGGALLIEALQRWPLPETIQPESGVTYAHKLSKEEAEIDFSETADTIARKIRGYNPVPVAWTSVFGERMKLFSAHVSPDSHQQPIATLLGKAQNTVRVACGEGSVLALQEVQWAGGKRLPAALAFRDV
jgi:methionyl-tRNA formyltransferase